MEATRAALQKNFDFSQSLLLVFVVEWTKIAMTTRKYWRSFREMRRAPSSPRTASRERREDARGSLCTILVNEHRKCNSLMKLLLLLLSKALFLNRQLLLF